MIGGEGSGKEAKKEKAKVVFALLLLAMPFVMAGDNSYNWVRDTSSDTDDGMHLYFQNVPLDGFSWNTTDTGGGEQRFEAIVGHTIFWGGELS